MRVLGGAVLGAAVVLALTGCGSQAPAPTTTASVTVAPTAAATTAPASPTATPTPTPTGVAPTPTATRTDAAADPGRPANQCTDLGVTVTPADGGGGAGSEEYLVLFVNTGGTTCALRGTPGVSVVRDGAQVGRPAARNQTDVRTVTLRSGETVAAPLRVVDIGTDGGPLDGCTVRKGTGYRVYPPHSTRAYEVDAAASACDPGPSSMTVGPVVPRTD